MQYRAEGGEVEGAGDDHYDSSAPEFEMPEGLDIPQGETKEVMATIRNKGGGMACLEAVGGVAIGKGQQEEMPESMKDMEGDEGTEANFQKFMAQAQPQPQAP